MSPKLRGGEPPHAREVLGRSLRLPDENAREGLLLLMPEGDERDRDAAEDVREVGEVTLPLVESRGDLRSSCSGESPVSASTAAHSFASHSTPSASRSGGGMRSSPEKNAEGDEREKEFRRPFTREATAKLTNFQ